MTSFLLSFYYFLICSDLLASHIFLNFCYNLFLFIYMFDQLLFFTTFFLRAEVKRQSVCPYYLTLSSRGRYSMKGTVWRTYFCERLIAYPLISHHFCLFTLVRVHFFSFVDFSCSVPECLYCMASCFSFIRFFVSYWKKRRR